LFYANPCTGETDKLRAQVRWRVSTGLMTAEYFNNDTLSWESAGTQAVVAGEVWDLYLLVRKVDNDPRLYEAAFVAKKYVAHQQTDAQVHNWGYTHSEYIVFTGHSVPGDDTYALKETDFGVEFDSPATVLPLQTVEIHTLGYVTVRGDEGVYLENNAVKGGDPIVEYNHRQVPGRSRRYFDDLQMFSSREGEPTSQIELYKLDEDYKTPAIHFYDGFLMSFAGKSAFGGDSWTLQRSATNDIDSVSSNRLHGYWVSRDESETVTIYADALDSSLDTFRADCFVVQGVNVASVKVVGKDTIGAAWTDLGTIDLTRGRFTNAAAVEGDHVTLRNSELELVPGTYDEHVHYLRNSNGAAPVLKIVSTADTELTAKKKSTHAWAASEVHTVTSSRGKVELLEEVEHRFLGFQIEPQSTYEGYFKISVADFGMLAEMPGDENADVGSGELNTFSGDSIIFVDNQSVDVGTRRSAPSFTYTWGVASAETYLTVLAMIDKVSLNSKPVWVFPKSTRAKDDSFELCLIDGSVSHSILRDFHEDVTDRDDNQPLYSVALTLRSVGE